MSDPLDLDRLREVAESRVEIIDTDGTEWTTLRLADVTALIDRVAELTGWKESAMEVLSGWEAVHLALGRPGRLGESKSKGALERVAELTATIERVEALLRDAERTFALNAHKPNVDYESGFIDLMRFLRAALKGDS